MTHTPRVLVLAEAANPEFVSVPLIGWSLAEALREVADVHLVTQIRNTAAIERAGYTEGREFTSIDTEALARPLMQAAAALRRGEGNWSLNSAFASVVYPQFERRAWARFGPQIRAGAFDVVHRITPVTHAMSGPFAARCARAGVPFVLGPLNGGLKWPDAFRAEMSDERELLSRLRPLHRARPGWRRMLQSCAAILSAARHVDADLPAALAPRLIRIPENGIDRARFPAGSAAHRLPGAPQADGDRPPAPPLRACFIGRLAPVKGLAMGIEAAAPLLADGRMTLDIVGTGEIQAELESLCQRLGLTEAVTFHGWVPHARIAEVVAPCNLLLFPSLKDFGGGAVLEAMAMGLVPVVLDYGGPAELVTADTGIAVPMTDRAGTTRALRAALDRLADDPARLTSMAAAAVARVDAAFTWPAKARQIAEVYAWVLGQRPDKPVFPAFAP